MKAFIVSLFLFITAGSKAQHQVQKLWETDSVLAIPESVLPYQNVLYVSLIDGNPWEKDGKGEIAQVSRDGKIINNKWITGLNAPKGMGIWQNKLYVADVSDVVIVDIAKGKIDNRIAINGAEGLNDITVDQKGVVYVSDSKSGSVYKIQNNIPALYLSNLKGANGVKAIGTDLYILTAKEVYKADAAKKLSVIGELQYGGDGIEPVGNDFIVTSWSGYMYYLQPNKGTQLLLDTHEHKNTADIGYDAARNIIYVPTFMGKSVAAYKLD